MKKTIYLLSLIAFIVASFTSCDVTREPKGTPVQAPFKSVAEAEMNRDALYALLRNTESPTTLNAPDIMSDLYQVNKNDNNTIQPLYAWQRQSVHDHDMVLGYYFNNYYSMMQANYFIMRAEELINNENVEKTDAEVATLNKYIGEAKVIRALAHWRIVQRFARPWAVGDPDDRTMGIIISDKYAPLEIAKAPKSSRKAVYDLIYSDLDFAIANIPADANKEVKPAIRITQDFAYAVKARAALTRQDWNTAAECSKKVMDKYPLQPKEELYRIWQTEDSPEILVRLFTTKSIGGVSASMLFGGGQYLDEDRNGKEVILDLRLPVVVLAAWVPKIYSDKDQRKTVYVKRMDWYYVGSGAYYHGLQKFAGNPSLTKDPKRPEYKFGIHLFNAGEAYLINAEANAMRSDVAAASEALQRLKEARGAEFDPNDFLTPDDLMNEIRVERVRELVGEGFRMNDLVRWNEGMSRNAEAQELPLYPVLPDANDLTVTADNDMLIWEFPSRDVNQNPDLSAHRNWK